ncbi:MAG TPA: macro domain-containing protein [Gemmatimonadales bacterium]|nr:macro domain-containing protein [Gemmatimonadales bacterium]
MIRVITGELAALPVDAVVRAADDRLQAVGSASERLDRLAGERFGQLCHVQAPLDVGAAVVTGAGELTAEFVLHVVIQSSDHSTGRDTIRRALASAWHRAEGWQLGTVAAPLVGLGLGGIALEEAVGLLVESFRGRTGGYPAELHIVLDSPEQAAAVEALIRRPA